MLDADGIDGSLLEDPEPLRAVVPEALGSAVVSLVLGEALVAVGGLTRGLVLGAAVSVATGVWYALRENETELRSGRLEAVDGRVSATGPSAVANVRVDCGFFAVVAAVALAVDAAFDLDGLPLSVAGPVAAAWSSRDFGDYALVGARVP